MGRARPARAARAGALAVWTPTAALSAATQYHPATGFGGYNWFGDVTQISAQWKVPAILASSAAGHASTWIGAQNDEGQPPFIQLGTTEDKFSPSAIFYEAFWSDVTAGYHPQTIVAVQPGDLVSAAMVQRSNGWALTFTDLTTGKTRHLTIHYGAGQRFDQAEWLQEDPTADSTTIAKDLPYPALSSVAFSHVLVNRTTPTLHLEDGATLLATSGIFLVPSMAHDGAFSLTPPAGASLAYLQAASALDQAIAVFQVDTLHWSHISKSRRKAIAKTLGNAYGLNAFELGFYKWPARAKDDALTLFHQDQLIQHDVKAWSRSGLSLGSGAYSTMTSDQSDGQLAIQLRADLGAAATLTRLGGTSSRAARPRP